MTHIEKINCFADAEARYNNTKPVVSKLHTLEQDVRPIGARTRKWERIIKVSDTCYALSCGGRVDPVFTWGEADLQIRAQYPITPDEIALMLGHTRTNFVFGSGNPNADIMIVGEAPGADEDEQGLPFVGRAGQLLTKILEAIDLPRDEVYICNILKCRPPNNRKPLAGETDQCEPYLWKQIEIVKPKLILALGLTAANTLLKNKESMTNLRGKIHDYHGIRTLVTYHPAALLRNPEWKKYTWDDVKLLRNLYDAS